MSKKIAVFNFSANGSTGNIVNDLAEASFELGFKTYFFGGEKIKDKHIENLVNTSSKKTTYLINRIQTFIFGNDGFLHSFGTHRSIKMLNKLNPDIIHIHNVHGSYLNVEKVLKYAFKKKKKVIWSIHDNWLLSGRCGTFYTCEKWKTGCGKCKRLNLYPKSLFDYSNYFFNKKRSMIKKFGNNIQFVTPSKWLFDIFKNEITNANIKIIPNGVDSNIFKPTQNNQFIINFANGRKVIGGAAFSFNTNKGIEDFFNLSEKLDSSAFCFVLIGLNICSPKIENNILYLPRTCSKNEMASFYSSLDWFFNPTKMETFGLTNIESLLCLTPVITYKAGGTTEVVSAIPGGYVVEQRDIDAVIKIINNEKPVVDQNSARKFDKKNTIHSYLELYK